MNTLYYRCSTYIFLLLMQSILMKYQSTYFLYFFSVSLYSTLKTNTNIVRMFFWFSDCFVFPSESRKILFLSGPVLLFCTTYINTTIIKTTITYSVFTYFRKELIELSARTHGLLLREKSWGASEDRRREHGSKLARIETASELKTKLLTLNLSSSRLYKLQAKFSGNAIHLENSHYM